MHDLTDMKLNRVCIYKANSVDGKGARLMAVVESNLVALLRQHTHLPDVNLSTEVDEVNLHNFLQRRFAARSA